MSEKPRTDSIFAIDVVPYRWGVYCGEAEARPHVDTIVHMRWSDDGSKIVFATADGVTLTASPNALLQLVAVPVAPLPFEVEFRVRHELWMMQHRPQSTAPCPTCGAVCRVHG